MSVFKFVKLIFSVTIIALLYVHLQMQIIGLAYEGKSKEKKIHSLTEENGTFTYTILTLKSSSRLGVKMLSEDSGMQFTGAGDTIQISSSAGTGKSPAQLALTTDTEKRPSFFSRLALSSFAEANTQE